MMSPSIRLAVVLLALAGLTRPLAAQDWIASPSYFTHDPQTGERVAQFAPKQTPILHSDPNRTQSGMRHIRNSLQAGNSVAQTHIVEQWGNQPVRPYGEWRFPFRPYSAPYPYWGPPPNNFYGGVPFYGRGLPGQNFGGPFIDPYPPRTYPNGDPRTQDRPYDDGRYPSSRRGDDPTRRFEPYTPRGF